MTTLLHNITKLQMGVESFASDLLVLCSRLQNKQLIFIMSSTASKPAQIKSEAKRRRAKDDMLHVIY